MNIYRIKLTLRYVEPPVWRRIEVTGDTDLGELHEILQISMGWEDAHLHGFRVGSDTYGEPGSMAGDLKNEYQARLADLVGEGDTMVYDYDFGDGWEHDLTIEKIVPSEPDVDYPRCTGGEGACPPEDCGGPPGYANLLDAISDPGHDMHEDMLEWLGEEFDPTYFDPDAVNTMLSLDVDDLLPGLPAYDSAELASLSPAELFDILIENGDRVPRHVIDECAHRGDAMLEILESFLDSDGDWEDEDIDSWWLRLHAVMILGLMHGERAGELLLSYLRNIAGDEEHDLQDWLAGYWPALMRNKPAPVIEPIRAICRDKQLDWYPRANFVEVVLAAAQNESRAALEQALDWAAQIAADETENWTLRLLIAQHLIDFPRERHRDLLEQLADRQQFIGRHFDKKAIEESFAANTEQPEWDRFANPWQFYEPEAIEQRQRRWLEEDAMDDDPFDSDDFLIDFEFPAHAPFRHEMPKIGRNDPCPCGSGKKYKKCCLNRTLH